MRDHMVWKNTARRELNEGWSVPGVGFRWPRKEPQRDSKDRHHDESDEDRVRVRARLVSGRQYVLDLATRDHPRANRKAYEEDQLCKTQPKVRHAAEPLRSLQPYQKTGRNQPDAVG